MAFRILPNGTIEVDNVDEAIALRARLISDPAVISAGSGAFPGVSSASGGPQVTLSETPSAAGPDLERRLLHAAVVGDLEAKKKAAWGQFLGSLNGIGCRDQQIVLVALHRVKTTIVPASMLCAALETSSARHAGDTVRAIWSRAQQLGIQPNHVVIQHSGKGYQAGALLRGTNLPPGWPVKLIDAPSWAE